MEARAELEVLAALERSAVPAHVVRQRVPGFYAVVDSLQRKRLVRATPTGDAPLYRLTRRGRNRLRSELELARLLARTFG
jgi:hypothetical protein